MITNNEISEILERNGQSPEATDWFRTWERWFNSVETGEAVWPASDIRNRTRYSLMYLDFAVCLNKQKVVGIILDAFDVPKGLSIKESITYILLNKEAEC